MPTAIAAASTAATTTHVPLTPLPDQLERWHAHRDPIAFDVAAQHVLDAAVADGVRRDVPTTDLSAWAFGSHDGRTMELAQIPYAGRHVLPPVSLREHAFAQLTARIGAPASYVRELPPKLAMACVNFGLTNHERPALLRTAGDAVRAIVSDRYAALDDALVLEILDETLTLAGLQRDAMVRAVATGPHTVIRVTMPSEGVAVRVGDVIEHGLEIANSELGLRSVQVTPITVRLVCTNGMRATHGAAATRLRHIGDPLRLRDAFREAVPLALAEARGDIARWKQSVDILIDDALAEVESLRAFGATTSDVQAIARTLSASLTGTDGPRASEEVSEALHRPTWLYDVSNAVTATARDRGTAARLELEQLAHRHLQARTR